MFERIAVELGHCSFCTTYGRVAVLYGVREDADAGTPACEKCIRAAGKAAELLKTLRQAKAKPPKKARKGSQSSGKGAPQHSPPGAPSPSVPTGSNDA